MAKKKEPVRWTVSDGVKPNRVGPARVFNLKSPTQLNLPPRSSVTLKLGVECNYPLHVFQARHMLQKHLHLVDGVWAAQDAGQEVVLTIENRGPEVAMLERTDVLARAFIMDNSSIPDEEE